jgi:ArsR family transcriptional regulator, arsenate/arsenite/antimonite-responsive transcriptional repressor
MINAPLDHVFRAFADENRLRILNLLSQGEICVCDIISVLKAPQPKVSRHLAYLKRAGLVQSRRDGLWMYYSLTPAEGNFHKRLLRCLDGCLDEAPVLKRDRKTLKALECREATCD